MSRHLERHLEQCTRCAQLRQLERRIGGKLAETSKAISCEPSPYLASKIKRGLQDLQNSASNSGSESSQFSFHLAAGVSIVLLLAGIASWYFLRPIHSDLTQPSHLTQSQATEKTSVNKEETRLDVLLIEPQIKEWVTQIDEPLAQELASVVGDAKAALNLLTFNFVPDRRRDTLIKGHSAN